jgi:hypothetical protein
MLGRLRMTLEEALDNCGYLFQEAFAKNTFVSRLRRFRPVINATRRRTASLEEALKKVIGEDWATKLFNDGSECSGKVYGSLSGHMSVSWS